MSHNKSFDFGSDPITIDIDFLTPAGSRIFFREIMLLRIMDDIYNDFLGSPVFVGCLRSTSASICNFNQHRVYGSMASGAYCDKSTTFICSSASILCFVEISDHYE